MQKRIVIVSLLVLVLLLGALGVAAQQEDSMPPTVGLSSDAALGNFLVDADGMTLYMFANDEPGVSNCYDQCAENWPPLLVGENERPTLDAAITGRIGLITREDGSRQVAYDGMPLYTWTRDSMPGDANGQGVNDVWFVVNPPTVALGSGDALSNFLVNSDGMTLYMFANDEMGVSNCYDQCAENWPPLLVESPDAITVLPGLIGDFGTAERTDGTLQVTYDDMPLYTFVRDTIPGDVNGQGVNDVWFVVQPPSVNIGSNDELGNFLIGPDGMTLYLFTNDIENMSNCYDNCAVAWPPLLVAEGEMPTAGEGIMGNLGVIERDDGGLQVTYDAIPLYYWINDVIPGDTTGEGVRDVWYVIDPNEGM